MGHVVNRPWWWWINPWLYAKRRAEKYDAAIELAYELCDSIEFYGSARSCKVFRPDVVANTMTAVVGRCKCCGGKYIKRLIESRLDSCNTSPEPARRP